MSDFRIEDLFEPLSGPDEPAATPASLDAAVEQYGFDDVYATLQRLVGQEGESGE